MDTADAALAHLDEFEETFRASLRASELLRSANVDLCRRLSTSTCAASERKQELLQRMPQVKHCNPLACLPSLDGSCAVDLVIATTALWRYFCDVVQPFFVKQLGRMHGLQSRVMFLNARFKKHQSALQCCVARHVPQREFVTMLLSEEHRHNEDKKPPLMSQTDDCVAMEPTGLLACDRSLAKAVDSVQMSIQARRKLLRDFERAIENASSAWLRHFGNLVAELRSAVELDEDRCRTQAAQWKDNPSDFR